MQIHVIVKANSRHDEGVTVGDDNTLTVRTKAPAIEGRANDAIIRLVAKHLGTSKSNVRLVRGSTSKYKTLEITE